MSRIHISKKELISLYYKQKKSKYEIGRIYNCSFKTVLNRMREYGMKPLSRSIIQSKYLKKNFTGDECEKAYIIGFRLGDLNVYQTAKHSEVIIVRCHTTKKEQLGLIKKLFSKYGRASIGGNNKKGSKYINCFLNKSFVFLLPKEDKVENWITKNPSYSNNFVAGYIDAEANIGVYDGRARFKIDSYDKNIIFWIYNWLLRNNIFCPKPLRIGKKGQVYDKELKYKYNEDLWRIRVSDKNSLCKLLLIIKPLLRHKTRLQHVNKCLINLNIRNGK
jgi:hypothetical protein